MTVATNANLKEDLMVLWRNIFCANMAPGQPQARPHNNKVRSEILEALLRAAILSMPYMKNAMKLMTR